MFSWVPVDDRRKADREMKLKGFINSCTFLNFWWIETVQMSMNSKKNCNILLQCNNSDVNMIKMYKYVDYLSGNFKYYIKFQLNPKINGPCRLYNINSNS